MKSPIIIINQWWAWEDNKAPTPSQLTCFPQAHQQTFRPVLYSSISQSPLQYFSNNSEHAVTCCASTPLLKPELFGCQTDLNHRERNHLRQNHLPRSPKLNHSNRLHCLLRQPNTSAQHDRCPPQLRSKQKRNFSAFHHQLHSNLLFISCCKFFLFGHFFGAGAVAGVLGESSEQSADIHSVLHLPVHSILGAAGDADSAMDAGEQDLPGEEHSAEDQVPLMLHIYIHSSPSDYIHLPCNQPSIKAHKKSPPTMPQIHHSSHKSTLRASRKNSGYSMTYIAKISSNVPSSRERVLLWVDLQ